MIIGFLYTRKPPNVQLAAFMPFGTLEPPVVYK